MKQNVDNPFQSPAVLSLCPGFLGLERGLIRAIGSIRVLAYVEIEAFIIANLVAEMELGKLAPAPIWSDIKTLRGEMFRGKIDGIMGGYPCQPFSNAGARNGTSDPRHLYPYISGIIKAAGPIWCFFENVEGHLSLGYPEVSADLRSMGYAVEAGIYSAEEVGAPHQRDRLFILAIKHEWLLEYGKWGLPECESGQERSIQGCSTDINGRSEDVVDSGKFGWDTIEKGFEQAETDGLRELPPDEQSGRSIKCGAGEPGSVLSGELEHPNVISSFGKVSGEFREISKEVPNNSIAGREVGDTTSHGQQECGYGIFGELQAEAEIGIHDRSEQSGITGTEFTPHGRHRRADTEGQGLERSIAEGSPPARRYPGEYDDALKGEWWPSRPGEQQFDWEEPRTATDKEQAKRGMGGSIDGYNFREDLLRAYGNSVVEQTAEIAFIDLLDKHFKNYGIAK